MSKKKIKENFERIIKTRAMLAQALQTSDESRILNTAKACIEQNADLVDLVGDLLDLDSSENDFALLFSDVSPNGEIVPLSWVPQIDRYCDEPITVVRVSKSMIPDLMQLLQNETAD